MLVPSREGKVTPQRCAEASDKLIVEETLRRGLRFMNIERSKALDDTWLAEEAQNSAKPPSKSGN